MRNISTPALILSVHAQGENNRSVLMFSPDEGLLHGTLYGGPKSKLRALVSPMNSGTIYLYRNEAKNQTKITDFDVRQYHLSFRENLFKTWAASLAAEILIKTQCAGSYERSWRITNGFMDGMDRSSEEESRLGLIRFLWRYIGLLGVRPDTLRCCRCGESLHAGKFTGDALSCTYSFSRQENGFACRECGGQASASDFTVGKPALTYLESVASLSPGAVRNISISETSFLEMRRLAYFLIEQACGTKLHALETGAGIL